MAAGSSAEVGSRPGKTSSHRAPTRARAGRAQTEISGKHPLLFRIGDEILATIRATSHLLWYANSLGTNREILYGACGLGGTVYACDWGAGGMMAGASNV